MFKSGQCAPAAGKRRPTILQKKSKKSARRCSSLKIVTECQSIFNSRLPSVIIPDRCEIFRVKYESCNNSIVIQAFPVPAVTFAAFVILMHYLGYSLFCKLHTSDRLIILHIDCILVFIVYCFSVYFFLSLGDE